VKKGRLEAFSDGVIAIIITIMVLEFKVPQGGDLAALQTLGPTFCCYVLSFVMLGIYWNNHHHLFQAVEHVGGGVLWANIHLLFWLSLVPLATAWMGEYHSQSLPVALYGAVLFMSATAYTVLVKALLKHHGKNSTLAKALGSDRKGKISWLLYVAAMPLAFVSPLLAGAVYVSVACIWLVPDRRIEKVLGA